MSRTLAAIELLADAIEGVSVQQLSEDLGLEKSIASRLLKSLFDAGYVTRDDSTDTYSLSLRLLAVASRYADRVGFPTVCQPALEKLSDASSELVQLSVVENDGLLLSAYAQARQQLAILPALGRNTTLHATASGKAWLATMPEKEALKLALHHGLTEQTPNTITEVGELTEALAKVREDGFALAIGEFTEEVNSIAYPVGSDRLGSVVATVAISAPASRLDRDRIAELVPLVAETAAELEAIWPIGVRRSDQLPLGDRTLAPH